MVVEPDEFSADGVAATVVALLVVGASFAGLRAAADGSGTSHVVGVLFGASIFGYLAYWVVRGIRG